jgi:hypothetical protein
MHDLYGDDILAWSEQQAENLRRRAANSLDWDNLAEEIEDVGRSQLRAVESHLVQALLHWLKVRAWPSSRDIPHWRAEIRGQRDDARAAFAPSMAQRLDVETLYQRALRRLPETNDDVPPRALPDRCLFSLDDLLGDIDLGDQS